MKKLKTVIFTLPFCASIFFLIFMKDIATAGALYGAQLCYRVVIPAIFPFTVLTKFFFNSGMCDRLAQILHKPFKYIFGISGNGAAVVLLSLISGYPVCTSLSSDLYESGKISRDEALALISYTNNATPSFIIGYIGISVLSDSSKGIFIYICVILSALIYGIMCSKKLKSNVFRSCYGNSKKDLPSAFVSAVTSGCNSAISICGFIIIFSVIGSALKLLPKPISSVLLLLSELTVGIGSSGITEIISNERLLTSVICAAVSLSGMCVLCQVRACMSENFKICAYIKGKSVQSLICFALSFCFFPLFFN